MIVLFQSMQSALSLVYDREVGVMRVMLVTPLPRPFLLFAKILAATVLALLQAAIFLAIAAVFGIFLPLPTLILILIVPAVILAGLMLGSIGLVVSVYTRQIENPAGMMNFVILPLFFLYSALYPLWKLREAGVHVIVVIANWNPFTHAVELVRFAAYGQFILTSFLVVSGTGIVAFALAVRGYNPLIAAFGQVKRD